MDDATIARLTGLNRKFYSQFGEAFALTRRRLQDGVRRVLAGLPDEGAWLDLGCGGGALAVEWLARGRRSAYLGLDFSAELLAAARQAVESARGQAADCGQIRFETADLSADNWLQTVQPGSLRGALAFAVLHHIPSAALRAHLLERVWQRLAPGGCLVHSEWQFQHSPKMMARRLPWSAAGLDEALVEPGDTLLDWRFSLPGQAEQSGLRYVHLFERDELSQLAAACGFEIVDEFESDGHGGRLGLYQVWRRA